MFVNRETPLFSGLVTVKLHEGTKDRCQLDPTPAAAPASARYCQINACRDWLDTSWNYYLMYILICLFVSPQWKIFFFLIKIV